MNGLAQARINLLYKLLLVRARSIDRWSLLLRFRLPAHCQRDAAEHSAESGHGELWVECGLAVWSLWLPVYNRGSGWKMGATHDVGTDLPPGDGVHGDHDGCCLEGEGAIGGGLHRNGSVD